MVLGTVVFDGPLEVKKNWEETRKIALLMTKFALFLGKFSVFLEKNSKIDKSITTL